MKKFKNLYPQIVSFENLLLAANKAAKGKRERAYVLEFFKDLEENLFQLQQELDCFSYKPGHYTTFHIYKPKPRLISAAPFRDRIVHHALINVIGQLLEKSFIFDTYANRKNKGTHQAILRYQQYLRAYKYALKCDIKKFFPSIDHAILKSFVRQRIADAATLWLIDTIIDNSNEQVFVFDYFAGDNLFTPLQRRKGLPIGNLTSQYFANFYLSAFDHYVQEVLQVGAYLRYVDDFVLFADSKRRLRTLHTEIAEYLESLRLRLNLNRCQLYPCSSGMAFLGQVVFRHCRRLKGDNVKMLYKRLDQWQLVQPGNMYQRIAGWLGHARQANTDRLLSNLKYHLVAKEKK